MNNLLPWIVIGAAGIGGVALYLFQKLGTSEEAKRIGEVLAEDDSSSVATVGAVLGSVDASSSSSSSSIV